MVEPIIPVFKLWNNELRCWQWGLTPLDYDRVQRGYGCGHCLEPFAAWVPVCYVCGEPNEAAPEQPLPRQWIKQGE